MQDKGSKRKADDVEIITLDDSDSEEPPSKKMKEQEECSVDYKTEENSSDSRKSQGNYRI